MIRLIPFLIIFLGAIQFKAYANNRQNDAHIQLEKSLTKELNLKNIEFKETELGHKYILLETQTRHKILADSIGNIIFPTDTVTLCTKIEYIKPGYFFDWPLNEGIKNPLKYGSFKATAEKNKKLAISFIDINGTTLSSYIGSIIELYPKDSTLCILKNTTNNISKYGLITINGIELLAPIYDEIEINSNGAIVSLIDSCNCKRKGALMFGKQNGFIPCNFHNVAYNKKLGWCVQPSHMDNLIAFNADSTYNCDKNNEGQILFERGKYQEVIDFYTYSNTTDSLSSFYISISRYKIAYKNYCNILDIIFNANPQKPILYEDEISIKESLFSIIQELNSSNELLQSQNLPKIFSNLYSYYTDQINNLIKDVNIKTKDLKKIIASHNNRVDNTTGRSEFLKRNSLTSKSTFYNPHITDKFGKDKNHCPNKHNNINENIYSPSKRGHNKNGSRATRENKRNNLKSTPNATKRQIPNKSKDKNKNSSSKKTTKLEHDLRKK